MKKFMAVFFVAMLLVMSLGNIVTAMADLGTARPFSIYVQCMNSDSYTDEEDAFRKTVNSNMIYVRHWVTGGSDSYTNHFRGRKSLEGDVYTRVNCGAKWCTVNMNVPIQSNSIKNDSYYYSISGRGNTNHYDYDGVSNVTLHGNMYF